MAMVTKYVFGPVPSRRLGRSLGVNNIPRKYCSYSCIYCQIGRTTNLEVNRKEFYPPSEIIDEVIYAVSKLESDIDYITIVPDGEPTLDINLGVLAESINMELEVPLAILTNSSLIYRKDVREDLMPFDLVSLKIDAVSERIWKVINRPHPELKIERILKGIVDFSHEFKGKIITETMLIKGVNDSKDEILRILEFISQMRIDRAYLAIPTRPPAEKWVKPATEETITFAFQLFKERLGDKVELLITPEKGEFLAIEDPVSDFLRIISVHPMRLRDAYRFLEKAGFDATRIIEELIKQEKVAVINYKEEKFVIIRYS